MGTDSPTRLMDGLTLENEMTLHVPTHSGFFAAILALALVGCDQGKSAENKALENDVSPEVGVITLTPESVVLTTELPGRTAPYRVAEVRPQVGGVIIKRLFTEGSEVQSGQQLYQIDPAPYQAAVDAAKAGLANAQAGLKVARLRANRYTSLVRTDTVSRQAYDDAIAAVEQGEAQVAATKAAVETARINLEYTKVYSPISGRIGRSSVTEGALVTANQAAPLATVQQLDPIYVDVTQSSAELFRLQNELENGRLHRAAGDQPLARLFLEDGTEYAEDGRLLFSEVSVDQGTGTVTLRAVFPNPKRRLLPGMFVRTRIEEGMVDQAILVPQQGVTRNQRGMPTALVVAADDKVQLRNLKIDRALDDKWLVSGGVRTGDRLIVEGWQKVRPGVPVRAVAVDGIPQPPSDASSAAQ